MACQQKLAPVVAPFGRAGQGEFYARNWCITYFAPAHLARRTHNQYRT